MNSYHLCVCIIYRHWHLTTLWRTVGTQGRSLVHGDQYLTDLTVQHSRIGNSSIRILAVTAIKDIILPTATQHLTPTIPSDDSVLALIARKAGRSLHSGEHYSQQRCSVLLHLVFPVLLRSRSSVPHSLAYDSYTPLSILDMFNSYGVTVLPLVVSVTTRLCGLR